jgi:hypothetical protein
VAMAGCWVTPATWRRLTKRPGRERNALAVALLPAPVGPTSSTVRRTGTLEDASRVEASPHERSVASSAISDME